MSEDESDGTDRIERQEELHRLAEIGRRGFLAAGLAGAGVALVAPAGAGASAGPAPSSAVADTTPPASPVARAASSQIPQMPLRKELPHLPAIPLDKDGIPDTLARLSVRARQTEQARQGLNRQFEVAGRTATAYEFLFGGDDWQFALERPEQFAISWTSFPDVYAEGAPMLAEWSSSLKNPDDATRQFWPMISNHGFGYNLIVPRRVADADVPALQRELGGDWSPQLAAAQQDGDLYVLDMTRFAALEPHTVAGAPRFTPSTLTVLIRDRRTKSLTPVTVVVSGHNGDGRTVYTRATATDGAWIYALLAAKTSVTVWGVWLGHVYHWHIVTAAMQMTMLNTLSSSHPLYQMLAPQSKYVIPFDDLLLSLWSKIAPPTSLAESRQFLELCNEFAAGRSYFDDDPTVTVARLGLREEDFSVDSPWDRYPVVKRLLEIWNLVEAYVADCVDVSYRSDAAVAADTELRAWIAAASSSDESTGGNIRGLPTADGRDALRRVLTSFVYRITVHGISRMTSSTSPASTYLANFPPCLQRTDIPGPRTPLSTGALLSYLPNTRTIGEMVVFYFTFAFSPPYEPFIPLAGTEAKLFFPGGRGDPRNHALIALRDGIGKFIDEYQPDLPQRFQWPLNIEL